MTSQTRVSNPQIADNRIAQSWPRETRMMNFANILTHTAMKTVIAATLGLALCVGNAKAAFVLTHADLRVNYDNAHDNAHTPVAGQAVRVISPTHLARDRGTSMGLLRSRERARF